jgi:transposase InsO family protein
LIHSDICGPITPASNGNKRYILTFIDDFSRKTWAYILVEKSSALECFKKFRSMVEKKSEQVICFLRTDKGGEFNSLDFMKYCEDNGIKRKLIAAYTPQQNDTAERKNITIMDMVRSMLSCREVSCKNLGHIHLE